MIVFVIMLVLAKKCRNYASTVYFKFGKNNATVE